jgi:hypothetical protein
VYLSVYNFIKLVEFTIQKEKFSTNFHNFPQVFGVLKNDKKICPQKIKIKIKIKITAYTTTQGLANKLPTINDNSTAIW